MVTGTNIMRCKWFVESVETRDVDRILVWNNKVKRHWFGDFCTGVKLVVAQ